ncbi:FAD-dependent oxidoreductase [Actinoallomurus sp. NPDC050550]|uniref:NAD(P)/FAD-dependent oxidoreductase n=1 Tax=Actinoallomurus sp. NPDC050550 TaxID=3154937 RepID=UPI0034053B8E
MHIVVVGASLAGVRTVQALRRRGSDARITLIGSEPRVAADRPPLSKTYLADPGAEAPPLLSADRLAELHVDTRLGRRATGLDLGDRTVALDAGDRVRFDALVVATGSAPRLLPGVRPGGGVHVLRTPEDAAAIRAGCRPGARVVVVGGGFIGAEVAWTARGLGCEVTIVEPRAALMERGLGPYLGAALTRMHTRAGVTPRLGTGVAAVERAGGDVAAVERAGGDVAMVERSGVDAAAVECAGGDVAGVERAGADGAGTDVAGDPGRRPVTAVRLTGGECIPADLVVLGVGAVPETGWLTGSGLTLDDGILCDEHLAAIGAPGVYAAGDVARWHHPRYGEAVRGEHWTNAVDHAAVVAANLTGDHVTCDAVPYVWSDQLGGRLQIYGRFRPEDEVRIVHGDPEDGRFVAVAGDGGALQGVAGFGVTRELAPFRRLLLAGGTWQEALDAHGDLAKGLR